MIATGQEYRVVELRGILCPPIDPRHRSVLKHRRSVVYRRTIVHNPLFVYTDGVSRYDAAPTMAAGLIRLGRATADMTQAELATSAGMTQQSVSAYETGRREPTLPTLKRILAGAGLEMRIRLEPIDRHDETLKAALEVLPASSRAELERLSRDRTKAARLRRIRGG